MARYNSTIPFVSADHIRHYYQQPSADLGEKEEKNRWKVILSKLNDRVRYARRVWKQSQRKFRSQSGNETYMIKTCNKQRTAIQCSRPTRPMARRRDIPVEVSVCFFGEQ